MGIRPREPTITGTATMSDCWNDDRPSFVASDGASGLIRAHAQNVTANPSVAITSMRVRGPACSAAEPGSVFMFTVASPLLD